MNLKLEKKKWKKLGGKTKITEKFKKVEWIKKKRVTTNKTESKTSIERIKKPNVGWFFKHTNTPDRFLVKSNKK